MVAKCGNGAIGLPHDGFADITIPSELLFMMIVTQLNALLKLHIQI